METAALHTFVEVMRRRSFAAVAKIQNIAPSSVSRTIAALEAELGVRLFQRTTRSLAPTEAALAYFDRVEPIVDELAEASLVATDRNANAPRGLLRITAAVSFAQVNLVPLLPEFARRFPQVRFDLLLTDESLDLVGERIDVAVRVGQLADSSLIAHRLCAMSYVVCASPAYLRARKRPRTPRELEGHDCLRYPIRGNGARWRFRDRDGATFDVPIAGRVVATTMMALVDCAIAGMGIVMLPRWCVAAALRTGALVELFAGYRATASEFELAAWVLYPSRNYVPLKVRAFVEFLQAKFRAGAPAEQVASAPRRTPGRPSRRRTAAAAPRSAASR